MEGGDEVEPAEGGGGGEGAGTGNGIVMHSLLSLKPGSFSVPPAQTLPKHPGSRGSCCIYKLAILPISSIA